MADRIPEGNYNRRDFLKTLLVVVGAPTATSIACWLSGPRGPETENREGMFIPLPDAPIELVVENQAKPVVIQYSREVDKLQVRKDNIDNVRMANEGIVPYNPVGFVDGQKIERWPGEILSTRIEKFKIVPEAASTGVGVLKTVWTPQNINQWTDKRIEDGEVVHAIRVSTILKADMWTDGAYETNKINLTGESNKLTNGFAVGILSGQETGRPIFQIQGYVPHDKVLIPA